MGLTSDDLRLFAPNTVAQDFSTSNVGGGMSATELTEALGEILFRMPSFADGSGSGDRVQRGKVFYKNKSTDTNFINGKIWIGNALDDFGTGTDTIGITSDSADDDSDFFYKIVGLDVNGDPVTLEVDGDGTTQALTLDQMSWVSRVTRHEKGTGNGNPESPAVGTVTIARGNGTILGVIPPGFHSATAEIDLFLATTLDDTVTIATAGADPAGASWSRPRELASAEDVANSGVLSAESGQGIWLRYTIKEGIQGSKDVEIDLRIDGEAAAA